MNLGLGKFMKFWGVAEEMAKLSKDPSTKVGAVALDANCNILATGYNGFPRGVSDSEDRYTNRDVKYKLISHAEQNIVAQAAYTGNSLRNSIVLVTSLYPCSSCAKSLIQAGVKVIITVKPTGNKLWVEEAEWSKLMFLEAGVHVEYIER